MFSTGVDTQQDFELPLRIDKKLEELEKDSQNGSDSIHDHETTLNGSFGYILQKKRSIDLPQSHPHAMVGDSPETRCKRLRREENKSAGNHQLSHKMNVLRHQIAELQEQLQKNQDLLDQERRKVNASHLRFKLCVDEVSDPAAKQTSRLDPAVEREVFLWESSFQYENLTFVKHEDSLISEDYNDHEIIHERMAEFRQNGLLCDLTIRGRGSTSAISCHSLVLCAVSSAIRTQICSKLHHGPELLFDNIPHESLIQLVQYAYTGQITLDEGNVLSVYSAAECLGVNPLITATSKFLSESTEKFDGVSCYKVLRFVEQNARLKRWIPMYKRRVMEHASEVFGSVECLVDMPIEFVIEILESDFVNFGPETEVVEALNRWVSGDRSREVHMSALGARIRWTDIDQDSQTDDVKAFKSKFTSTEETCSDQPKIGSRNGGTSGGFFMAYKEGRAPMLLDIETQKIKVLPEFPKSVYKENPHQQNEALLVPISDDGFFYVVLQFNYISDFAQSFRLLRLNVSKHGWDHVLEYQIANSDGEWGGALCHSVLAGKWCIKLSVNNKYFLDCLDLKDSKVKTRIALDDCLTSGISAGLSSIFVLRKWGKLIRFDARSCTMSDVKTDLSADQLRKFHFKEFNAAGQAVFSDGKTHYQVCMQSGRLIQSRPKRRPVRDGWTPAMVQDSILSLKFGEPDPPPKGTRTTSLEVFRDRGPLVGWNLLKTFSLVRPETGLGCGCRFARSMIKDLPDFI